MSSQFLRRFFYFMGVLHIIKNHVIILETKVMIMEKYEVIRVESEGFNQWLKLKKLSPHADKQEYKRVHSEIGFFKVGDIISRYVGFNGNAVAESYDLGRYKIIDFCDYVPKNDYEIEHFYTDLDFCDRIRLKLDVAQSLRSQGVRPSLSAQRNLRTLLSGAKIQEKVR